MREAIARAIYEAPGVSVSWDALPAARRQGWLQDADRVIAVLDEHKPKTCVGIHDAYVAALRAHRP